MNNFTDLKVYERAYESSLEIHKMSLRFPQMEQYELGSQIRRASKSVAMNIAEGYGKRDSLAEFQRYLTIALGSNDEVRVGLRYCKDLGYISEEEYVRHDAEHIEIGKMIRKTRQSWQNFKP